jgi:hypothetical protein
VGIKTAKQPPPTDADLELADAISAYEACQREVAAAERAGDLDEVADRVKCLDALTKRVGRLLAERAIKGGRTILVGRHRYRHVPPRGFIRMKVDYVPEGCFDLVTPAGR